MTRRDKGSTILMDFLERAHGHVWDADSPSDDALLAQYDAAVRWAADAADALERDGHAVRTAENGKQWCGHVGKYTKMRRRVCSGCRVLTELRGVEL